MTPKQKISFILLGVCLSGLFCALGTWQLRRLAWKEHLISTFDKAFEDPTILEIPQTLPSDKVLKVHLEGSFLPQALPLYTQGAYRIVCPLELSDNKTLYVVMGLSKTPLTHLDLKNIRLDVLLTNAPTLTRFNPKNDLTQNQWHSLNLDDFNSYYNRQGLPYLAYALSPATPLISPFTKEYFLNLPNNHLMYAITWFSLAFVIGILVLIYCIARRTPHDGLPKA